MTSGTDKLSIPSSIDPGTSETYTVYQLINQAIVDAGIIAQWSVWKRTPQEGDEPGNNEYLIFDLYESMEQMEKGYNGAELAQKAYKGKMSRRSIQRMLDGTGSESRERRNYVLEVVDATILAGGDVKPGDKASLNLMNKKSDDFENYESKIWKPIAEQNILNGRIRQWVLVKVKDRTDNAYTGFTHFAWNLAGNSDVEFEGMSGFKWDKLWEGIESSRDMSDATELTCVFAVN